MKTGTEKAGTAETEVKMLKKVVIWLLEASLIFGLAACSPEQYGEPDDTQLLSRVNHRVIETVLGNVEAADEITASDVVIDQMCYGSFSQPDAKEVLVICKILNMPHVGGPDRRAMIILEIDSMDVAAYEEIPADEVWVDTLPMSNGQDRIIFSGKSTYQGILAQYVMYFCIQDGQWMTIPVEELETLGGNCFPLTGDVVIAVSVLSHIDGSFGNNGSIDVV